MWRDWLVITGIAALPDLGLSWLYMKLMDGSAGDFWIALGILYAVQLFWGAKHLLAGSLVFRLYGKRRVVEVLHESFRKSGFPAPERAEGASEYLARLCDDEQQPLNVHFAAHGELARMAHAEAQGIFPGLRAMAAYEAAVSENRA